eukprot:1151180-Pelagomonas_calceolata.AAC.5
MIAVTATSHEGGKSTSVRGEASAAGGERASVVGGEGASGVGGEGASAVGGEGASAVGGEGASAVGGEGASVVGDEGASAGAAAVIINAGAVGDGTAGAMAGGGEEGADAAALTAAAAAAKGDMGAAGNRPRREACTAAAAAAAAPLRMATVRTRVSGRGSGSRQGFRGRERRGERMCACVTEAAGVCRHVLGRRARGRRSARVAARRIVWGCGWTALGSRSGTAFPGPLGCCCCKELLLLLAAAPAAPGVGVWGPLGGLKCQVQGRPCACTAAAAAAAASQHHPAALTQAIPKAAATFHVLQQLLQSGILAREPVEEHAGKCVRVCARVCGHEYALLRLCACAEAAGSGLTCCTPSVHTAFHPIQGITTTNISSFSSTAVIDFSAHWGHMNKCSKRCACTCGCPQQDEPSPPSGTPAAAELPHSGKGLLQESPPLSGCGTCHAETRTEEADELCACVVLACARACTHTVNSA